MTFYDKHGTPQCYTEDFTHIYDFGGNPVAYINSDRIWSYKGRCLGSLHNNWIIDRKGGRMFFSENSTGGPLMPLRKLSPLKRIKKLRPLKSVREISPLKPIVKMGWSDLDFNSFFRQ